MFQGETPLHEVRCMQLAIRNGGDRNRRKARASIGQGRGARKLAVREAGAEELIRGDHCVDGAVWNSRCDGGSTYGPQQSTLKGLRIRRIGTYEIGDAARQNVAEQTKACT